jgi:hypothetical protein
MILEVGKSYELRNGKKTTIKADHSDKEPIYPMFGLVYDEDGKINRPAFWTVKGRYVIEHESQFDITKILDNE